jgi:hypothetical protein
MSLCASAPAVVRVTTYDFTVPVAGAVQERLTLLSPGVASKLVGADGGVHTGVAEDSDEGAERQNPLLDFTT